MTTFPQNLANLKINPRSSTETDRRHLLAPSVAPSESASMIYNPSINGDGNRTPRAASPAPSTSTRRGTIADPTKIPQQPYKGFPSEAHYLAALREWAEEKKYIHYDRGLTGFYGHTTMEEYASRPSVNVSLGIKDKWRARKARKEGERADQQQRRQGRRATVT